MRPFLTSRSKSRSLSRAHSRFRNRGSNTNNGLRSRLDIFADIVESFHLLRILTALGGAAIIGGLFSYWVDRQDSSENKLFNSWQLLLQSAGGNSGKSDVINYLNTRDCWVTTNLAAGEGYLFDYFHANAPARCLSDFLGYWLPFAGTEKPTFGTYWDNFAPADTITDLPPINKSERIHLDNINLSRTNNNERPYYSELRLISPLTNNLKIRESELENSVFSGLVQSGLDLSGSNLDRSYFSDVIIGDTKLNCTNLRRSVFLGKSFKSSISISSIKYSDFYKSIFRNVTLSGPHNSPTPLVPKSSFVRSNFTSVTLYDFSGNGTDYSATIFDDFDYDENVFRGAFFVASAFRNGRRIYGYDKDIPEFQDANVSGADFTEFGPIPPNMLSGSYYCKEIAPPYLPDDFSGDRPEERQCGDGQRGMMEWAFGDTYDQDGAHLYRDYVLIRNGWTKDQLEECGISQPGENESGEILDLSIPNSE